MDKLKFSKPALDALPFSVARMEFGDTESKYLRLFVTAQSKAYYYVRKVAGEKLNVKIGEHPEIGPQVARDAAEKLSARVAMGEDIRPKRSTAETLDALCGEYIDQRCAGRLRAQTVKKYGDHRKYIKPLIGGRSIAAIESADVFRTHAALGKRGKYLANRCLALMSAALNYGVRQGLIPANPCVGVKKFQEKSRRRFLSAQEMKTFLDALAKSPQLWRDFFTVLLFTGARRGNVEAMQWKELDLAQGLWVVPGGKSKSGDEMRLSLHSMVVKLLKARRAAAPDKSQFVFPSHGKTGHVTEPKTAWKAILEDAGIDGLHIHDLRRTLGSWQAAAGASLHVIGRSLGHKTQAATAIYAQLDIDPVRESVNVAVDAMLSAGNISKKNKPR